MKEGPRARQRRAARARPRSLPVRRALALVVTDSPLFLEADGDSPEGLYPSGNFHSQARCLLLDALAVGLVQVGNLGVARLHSLLGRRFSGVPDQLAGEPGRLLDGLEHILASELLAARQAHHLRGRPLPARLEVAVDLLAHEVEPVGDERSLSDDVERVRALVGAGALLPAGA